MKLNSKKLIFFIPTVPSVLTPTNKDRSKPICFSHLKEFYPDIFINDLEHTAKAKCEICFPPNKTDGLEG